MKSNSISLEDSPTKVTNHVVERSNGGSFYIVAFIIAKWKESSDLEF